MRAFARRSTADHPDYDGFDDPFEAHDHFSSFELSPGERVCPPPSRSGGGAKFAGALLLLIALGCGWAFYGNPGSLEGLLPEKVASLISELRGKPQFGSEMLEQAFAESPMAPDDKDASQDRVPGIEESAPAAIESATTKPLDRIEAELKDNGKPEAGGTPPAEGPGEATGSAKEPVTINTAAVPEQAEERDEPEVTPLPPADPDPADPLQMRAAEVGLHPGLSRVLLSKLTATDYRNAAIAIKTALAKTADDAVYVWPRQRTPELALFKVHFVPGAAPGCRRYVVTITKDGWSTTALPMENCDSRPSRSVASRSAHAARR